MTFADFKQIVGGSGWTELPETGDKTQLQKQYSIRSTTDAANRTISGLPYGTAYTVTETPASGWVQVGEAYGNSTKIIGGNNNSYTATNAKTDSLTLTKALEAGTTNDGATPQTFTYNVTLTGASKDVVLNDSFFTVTNNDGATVTPANVTTTGTGDALRYVKTYTVVLKQDQTVTISGIPYGTDYAVTEDPVSGWTKGTEAYGNTPHKIAASGNSYQATNARLGSLTLQKELSNPPDGITADSNFKIKVTLRKPDDNSLTFDQFVSRYFDSSDISTNAADIESKFVKNTTAETLERVFTVQGNNTATAFTALNSLPYGTRYTIAETDASQDKTSSVEYKINSGSYGSTNSSTISGANAAAVRNTYPSLGSLKLHKALATGTTDSGTFTFHVVLTRDSDNTHLDLQDFFTLDTTANKVNGISVTNLSAAASSISFDVQVSSASDVTFTGIPYGTSCAVSETAMPSADWIKISEAATNTTTSAALTAPYIVNETNPAITYSVTNAKTNNLTLTKAINAGTTGEDATLFKYNVTLVAPTGMTFTYDSTNGLKINGNAVTFNNVTLTGSNTEVFETAPAISGEGSIATFTLRTSASQQRTISGLPYGTKYYVSEQSESNWVKLTETTTVDTYSCEQNGTIGSAASTATITNGKVGQLTVYKKLSGSSIPASILGSANYYTMTVNLQNSNVFDWSKYGLSPDGNGNVTVQVNVPADSSSTTSATITGIPYGTTCVVNETAPSTGEFSTTYCLTESGTYATTDASKTVTVNDSTPSPSVYVKNDYSNVIKLTLTKETENQPTSLSSKKYTFRITLTNTNGINVSDLSFSNGYTKPASITSGTPFDIEMIPGTPLEISGLPINTTYNVQEIIPNGGEGYTTTVKQNTGSYSAGTSANGSLTASTQSDTVNIKNTYPEPYDLTLKKIVVGKTPDSMGTAPKYKFHVVLTAPTSPAGVKLSDYNISGAALGTYDTANNKYDFYVEVPIYDSSDTTSVVKLTGIPAGTTYTVEEVAEKYYKYSSGNYTEQDHPANTRIGSPTGSVSTATALNSNAEVSITNTYPATHSLTLKKILNGRTNPEPAIAANATYYFRVVLTEPSGVDFASGAGAGFTPNYNIMVGGSSGTNAVTEAQYDSSANTLTFTAAVTANDQNGVVITGIPDNTQYTVQEVVSNSDSTPLTGHKIEQSGDTSPLTADETVTVTNTYRKITLTKTDSILTSSVPVQGATYYLLKLNTNALEGSDELVSAVKGIFEDPSKNITDLEALSAYLTVVKSSENGNPKKLFTTNSDGQIVIRDADVQGGLSDGTYLFYEESAPSYYTRSNTYSASNLIVINGTYDGSTYAYSKNYTNERKTGSLKLIKSTANGSTATSSDGFVFEVTLTMADPFSLASYNQPTARITAKDASNNDVNITDGSYSVQSSANTNTYTFRLTVKNGNDVTISGIPYDASYEVSEHSQPTGWTQYGDTAYSDDGKVISDTTVDTATITNMKNGDLNLVKNLSNGTDPEKDVNGLTSGTLNGNQNFSYKVTLVTPVGVTVDSGVTLSDGTDPISSPAAVYTTGANPYTTITFTGVSVSKNAPVIVKGVPYNTKYYVTEVVCRVAAIRMCSGSRPQWAVRTTALPMT